MIVQVANKSEFIPEWNGNKEENDPIVVTHKVPTMALREQLIPKPRLKLVVSPDGKSEGGETTIEIDNRSLIQTMLISIKGLAVNIDGKEVEIKTAGDLFGKDTPSILSGLVDELGTYFQKILNERVDSKN